MLEGGSEGKVGSENEAKWPELGAWLGPLELCTTGVCLVGTQSHRVVSVFNQHSHSWGD